MFLLEKYHDGSFSVGYERGDVVPLERTIIHRDLWQREYARDEKGTLAEVLYRNDDKIIGNWITAQHRMRLASGRIVTEFAWVLDHSGVDPETLKVPPTLYVQPWHEGALWKHTRIVAWSPEEARQKMEARINGYNMPGRIDGITWKEAVPFDQFEKFEGMCWMGEIGI